jgi:DNA-binding HxlR family transcriptional regulator
MDTETLHDIFKKKYSIGILHLLYKEGEMKNAEIKNELNPSSAPLSNTLDLLEDIEWINREEKNKTDVRYKLTSAGKQVVENLENISDCL